MYQHLDAAIVRAVAWPPGHHIPSWPDLVGEAEAAASWRPWLEQTLRIPGFAAAMEQATPVLARRVRDICEGRGLPENTVRKAVMAVMRYVLRASGRATPFGLFAGVAPVDVGESSAVHLGTRHRAIAGPAAEWLTAVIERLESETAVQPHLTVRAHALVVERDGHLVLEHRSSGTSGGPPARVRVRASAPVTSAMDAARSPILLADLVGKLATGFPGVPASVIARLLSGLVNQRFLITSLRPPMTTADPLHHLLAALPSEAAEESPAVAETVERLREIADGIARHNTAGTPEHAHAERGQLTAAMRNLASPPGPALTIDLRLEGRMTIPRLVTEEATRAADVLTKLAGRPALSTAWVTWHRRFLERYGPRALVPLLDAVDGDTGLGYPTGFLGGPPAPTGRTLTERDTKLLTLAQNAALRRQQEVALDETTVADLANPVPDVSVQPTTELTLRVHATSRRALDAGDFTLSIVGVSRTAGTTVGRFLNLLDPGDRDRIAKTLAIAPNTSEGALTVQISAPPLYASAENVARTPRVMPTLLALDEYHAPGAHTEVGLDDIAVTADVNRLYLVSVSRRRPLEFVTLNAVEPTRYTHPLVRFLTEATVALSIPCIPFDWGAAAGLPFLPALRHGRTILSPARWRLTAADLAGGDAEWMEWDTSLAAWRNQVAAPSTVYVGEGDQRVRLNLAESSHRALLRAQVQRAGAALLRAEPATGAAGWAGGRVHEIVLPMASATKPRPAPQWLNAGHPVGLDHGHLPGCGGRFFIKLYGRPDHYGSILTHHLPALLSDVDDGARWWFLPYRDPEDHLRLRLTMPVAATATTSAAIGAWSQRLRRAGLVARVQWDTDFPETARFGGEAAIDSAEAYFAADSQAAAAQLAASATKGGPDTAALTAASMLDLVTGLIGNSTEALTWLISHARTTTTAPARALYDQAVSLANPNHHQHLVSQPGGEQIVTSWSRRRDALAAYRTALQQSGTADATAVLPELLHLHHTRIAGVDLEAERQCLHLARAAALSWTARARGTS